MISPRFFGDDVLESCLAGHRMFDGSADPPESVALIQQALADLGYSVGVDGVFGSETGDAVTAYKASNNLTPDDPVVGPGTMGALDADFAHELIDAKADDVAGTRFDLGERIGTRTDLIDGFATCEFQNGICVEAGHVAAYAMPTAVQQAWLAASGLDGTFGQPTSDPFELDASRSVQEFTFAAQIFGGAEDFTLDRAVWEASIAGGSMIGTPLGAAQTIGAGPASFVPHDRGVVLAVPETGPQPLPQAVFDLWNARDAAGTSLGPPTGFAFPSSAGITFPFLLGSVTLNDAGAAGVASAGGIVRADLERYFQPFDIDLHLFGRHISTRATPIIGAAAAFAQMRTDIVGASGIPSFIYILSWHCNIDLPMIPGDPTSTLRSLLSSRAALGVQVRAMLWAGDPVPAPPTTLVSFLPPLIPWQLAKDFARMKTSRIVNEPAVNFINGLLAAGNDAAAILDDRHLLMGSHHQKAIIIGRDDGRLIAYVGGIELNRDRVEVVANEPGSPLFDITVRLEDASAFLVLQTFIDRWNLHPNKLGATPLRGEVLPLPLPAGGPLAVQVTHTYGRGFPFVNAVQTASTALANGIRSARQFFYMEDQYFVGSRKMRDAIHDALTQNPTLIGIIVIAAENSVADLPDVAFRRRDFLNPLATAFQGRLLIFERLGGGSTIGPTAYVHSKLLIVDDEAAFIGSVNSNRRSWFHDSEIDATLVDQNGPGGTAPGNRGVVRDFRCNLWSQHFNLDPALLGDFAFCLQIWQAIISGQFVLINGNLVDISGTVSVRKYNVGATVPRYAIGGFPVNPTLLDLAWNTLEDPS
jgi:phosphatidylserine/phosphatidylglycerophosphate/cardiolipin synthase-like enzyme